LPPEQFGLLLEDQILKTFVVVVIVVIGRRSLL
jgi:hypothetical protein